MRIACVLVPDFAVWAARREDPQLAGVPLAVSPVPPARGELIAVSPEARRAGLAVGMGTAAAQAVLPGAHFLRPDPQRDARARRTLLAALDRFTPKVEADAGEPGTFHLDLRGLARHHASEAAFAARLGAAVRGLGFPCGIGIASTRFAARAAAIESRGRIRIVPPGDEPAFLSPLPLAYLPLDGGVLAELDRLGLRTLGALAALPPETVAARFGRDVVRALALARGEDPTPLVPAGDDAPPAVAVDLDEPEGDLDRLAWHLGEAARRLFRALGGRGLALAAARLRLALEDGEDSAREARFLRPTLSPGLLVDCLRLALERPVPGARVRRFALEASETVPARPEQLLLFARRLQAADPAAVEAALARVRSLVGPQGVVAPRPADAWRPEARIGWKPFVPPADTPPRPAAATGALPSLPARLLASPLVAEVKVARDRLAFLRCPLAAGPIAASEGPHRLEGEWWGDGFAREYWTVTLEDGGRYWLFRDRTARAWFLQGVFD